MRFPRRDVDDVVLLDFPNVVPDDRIPDAVTDDDEMLMFVLLESRARIRR